MSNSPYLVDEGTGIASTEAPHEWARHLDLERKPETAQAMLRSLKYSDRQVITHAHELESTDLQGRLPTLCRRRAAEDVG
jgi:hypothetical protein